MGISFRIAMFITSFIPLWITVIIKNTAALIQSKTSNITIAIIVPIVLVIINLIACVVMHRRFRIIKSRNPETIILQQVTREKSLTTEFLVAYILPLFVFDFTNGWEILQFTIYFSFLAFLCIRNGNVYSNILLELQGYRYYTCQVILCTTNKPSEIAILSCNLLEHQIGRKVEIEALNKPIYLDRN